jgi:putative membrane protein
MPLAAPARIRVARRREHVPATNGGQPDCNRASRHAPPPLAVRFRYVRCSRGGARVTAMAAMDAWDLVAVGGAATLTLAYTAGFVRVWRRTAATAGVPWSGMAGLAGCVALLVAVAPPLAGLSDVLFAAHMGQHELLMLVAAPLLVLGRSLLVALSALPNPVRAVVVRHARRQAVRRGWNRLTSPATVLVVQAIVLWGWHVPWAFEAALGHEALHAFQHLTFLASAALFWWALVHGRFGRVGYGAGVLVLFVTAMHSGLLGALITFAPRPLYATHAARAAAAAVVPLEDQQLAGLIMWVPAGLLLAVAALALFAAWLGEVARRDRRATQGGSTISGRGVAPVGETLRRP